MSDSICNFFGSYAPDASIAEQRLIRSRRCNRLLAVEPMVWVHSWKTLLFLYLLVLGTTSYSWLILGHSGRAAAVRRHFFPRRKKCYFRRASKLSLYFTCTVNETLQNAPLDAAIAVDTAENRCFKVEVNVLFIEVILIKRCVQINIPPFCMDSCALRALYGAGYRLKIE